MEIRSDSQIAVIGAGTMGIGIAQIAAAAGHPVIVVDRDTAALDRGKAGLDASLAASVKRGRLADADAQAIGAAVRWTDSIVSIAGSALVVEAIVEKLDVKRALFREIEELGDPSVVFATNTSSLSVAQIGAGLSDPARFVGLHFFNPVPAMKLVEVVAAPATAPAVVAAISQLMRIWGKHPVDVADVPGFIVNRVARPYYAEAFLAWEDGVDPLVIDAALTGSGGFRMGPLTLADMIGHDINYAAAVSVHDGLTPAVRFRPQAAQARLVEQGHLGRKSQRGVYDYRDATGTAPTVTADPAADIVLPTAPGDLAPLLADLPGPIDPALPAGVLMVEGQRVALGDGRSLGARSDVDILIDHALDSARAPLLVATVRDEPGERAAAGLAAALGKALLLVPDRPGQIVLRTYAQLANGAVDAVDAGVAHADAIDAAMLHGANYPVGPVAWACSVGVDRVRTALIHIAAETGDPLYAPSAQWSLS